MSRHYIIQVTCFCTDKNTIAGNDVCYKYMLQPLTPYDLSQFNFLSQEGAISITLSQSRFTFTSKIGYGRVCPAFYW